MLGGARLSARLGLGCGVCIPCLVIAAEDGEQAMDGLEIEVVGVSRFARRLGEMADAIEAEIDEFLRELGARFEGVARGGAPSRTGRLARGIAADLRVRVDEEGVRFVTVGASEFYTPFQDRGAVHPYSGQRIGGHGFFRSATEDVEKRIARELEERIQRVVDSFGG